MIRILCVLCLVGCEGVLPGIDWQQMDRQDKLRPFEAASAFPDGRAMQRPPEHTVARDAVLDRPELTEGRAAGRYVERPPLPATRARLRDGHALFDTHCAPCHGLDGSGRSEVARNMELRPPPDLLIPPVTAFSAGRIFEVIGAGYGLMPGYADALSVEERWAVVLYLGALQLRAAVPLAALTPAQRARALETPGRPR